MLVQLSVELLGRFCCFCEMAMLNTGQASGCTKEVLLRVGWLTFWE